MSAPEDKTTYYWDWEGNADKFNHQAWQGMIIIRQEVAPFRPTQEEIDQILSNQYPKHRKNALAMIQSHPQKTAKVLRAYRDRFPELTGFTPSDAKLCATVVIDQIFFPQQLFAYEAYSDNNPKAFIYWQDLSDGVILSVKGVIDGERYLNQEITEENIAGFVDSIGEAGSIQLSPPDYADFYLYFLARYKQAAQTLQQDPTGRLLVDETVREIREQAQDVTPSTSVKNSGLDFPIPQFVLAGAEIGRLAYRSLLNLLP